MWIEHDSHWCVVELSLDFMNMFIRIFLLSFHGIFTAKVLECQLIMSIRHSVHFCMAIGQFCH
jgi:hypothetical protein